MRRKRGPWALAIHLTAAWACAPACASEPAAPSRDAAPAEGPSRDAEPRPAEAASSASSSVSALPPVSASARPSSEFEALEAAPALVYRQLDTGAIMGKNQLVTHRLHKAEGRALLIVETRSSKRAMALTPERIEPLGPATVRRFSGTVRTVGTLTTFEFADGADVLSL